MFQIACSILLYVHVCKTKMSVFTLSLLDILSTDFVLSLGTQCVYFAIGWVCIFIYT